MPEVRKTTFLRDLWDLDAAGKLAAIRWPFCAIAQTCLARTCELRTLAEEIRVRRWTCPILSRENPREFWR